MPPGSFPANSTYTEVENNLVELITQIRRRAPQARVVLVQYVALADETPCTAAPLLPDHAALARDLALRLAGATSRAAVRGGVEVLPMDRLSLAHTPCSA